MATPRQQIIDFIEQERLPKENVQRALILTQVYPSGKAWRGFVESLCLYLGGLAFGVAAIFFVAYNWVELGRFAKFAMVELLMVAGVIAYWKFGDHKIIGPLSLIVSTLLLGALMALYGQTYQTGADPWQLFFNWALLMLPWAFVARSSVLWIVWLSLLNLSILLYYQTFRGLLGVLFYSEESLLWIVFSLNTAALLLWEYCARIWDWLQPRWAPRLLAVGSGLSMTWLCFVGIFDSVNSPTGVAWLIWMGLFYFIYRKVKPDLFMLAGLCLSGIVVTVAFCSEYILSDADEGTFLLLAIIVLGLGAGSAVWLKRVNEELQS